MRRSLLLCFAVLLFLMGCGGDQNPIPRRKLELCERYGKMLSDAVERVLSAPMQPVSSGLRSAFEFVDLAYDELVTREKLLPVAGSRQSTSPVSKPRSVRTITRVLRRYSCAPVGEKTPKVRIAPNRTM